MVARYLLLAFLWHFPAVVHGFSTPRLHQKRQRKVSPRPAMHLNFVSTKTDRFQKTQRYADASSENSDSLIEENKGNKWKSFLQNRLQRGVTLPKDVQSTLWLIVLDVAFRKLFQKAKIRFPSSLAGCGVLLGALLIAQEQTKRQSTVIVDADNQEVALSSSWLYQQLQPGAALLAKWLPVFFVPSLVTLPLADGLGSAADLIKVTLVLVGGFLLSLWTTAQAVVAVRNFQKPKEEKTDSSPITVEAANATVTELEVVDEDTGKTSSASSSNKPFSGKLLSQLALASTASGLLAALGFVGAKASQYLTGVCFLTSTLASFVFGARLPSKFTKLVHPLVTCTTLTWSVVALLASLMGHSFRTLLRSYRTGSVWTGAGDILLFLLGPAVVSLAVSIFDRRKLVRDNAAAVGTAVGVATLGGVGWTALAVRLCGIGIPAVRLSLLSRNITSPLAMAMASMLGADVSLAVSMVVITGLIGANFGASILTAAGIKDPVARGLAMGSAAHGLGTAALAQSEPDAFSFSAIAMALVASAATVTVSVPFLRRVILEVALG